MKKLLKIVLTIIILLLVIFGALVIWQWDNIKVFTDSIKYTPEDMNTLITENENKIDEVFSELSGEGTLPGLTDDEQDRLMSGEMTEEEIEHVKEVLEASKDKTQNGEKTEKDNSPSRVNEIIAKIYVLRAEYVNRLNHLESEAIAEKNSTKKSNLTVNKILTFAEKYIDKATALESECDSKMESYIAELKAELQRLGQNTSMISEIRSTYKNEKKLKKSQLLNKYSKYLK